MNQSKMETILDLDKLQQMIKIQKETTTVSENKEAEKDERDLPKTGASIASTIGAGLAFIGRDYFCYLEERKRIDSQEI